MSTPPATAIDGLYAAFAHVPRPRTIDFCQCCHSVDEFRVLFSDKPLRQLDDEDLRPYTVSVLSTVGHVDDFRHFLPRILELSTAGPERSWEPGLEALGARLRRAGWTDWQALEREAVAGFFDAQWAEALSSEPGPLDAGDVLCALGNVVDDLTPYLAEWLAALGRPTARAQLMAMFEWGYRVRRGRRKLTNGYWREREEQAAQVITWLNGPELQAALDVTPVRPD